MKNVYALEMMSYVKLFFWFYKEFHNRFEWGESPKCVEFNTQPNAIKYKL
jgi:hypothetical protein